MDTGVSFGEWLRQRRRVLDLTQQELADCAGCSIVTIRKFESDERRPSKLLAELMAGCLQIPTAELEQFTRFARQTDLGSPEKPPMLDEPSVLLPTPAPPALRGNLPAPLTELIGRGSDITTVSALLQHPGTRLLTLTGPGGTGKTRLAIAAARDAGVSRRDLFPDGVWFVDLSAVGDSDGVLFAVARALETHEKAGDSLAAALHAHVLPWRAIAVLDNFEHVLDAADVAVNLLAAAPGLKVLVTSRRLLQVYGEHEFPVNPLPIPDAASMSDPDRLLSEPAVELFISRSRAANPAFELAPSDVADVVEICFRLDGLPLAIELAAARTRQYSLPELVAQLTSSLDLGGRLRYAPDRQQTLRQAVDWSYRLLDPEQQHFFRQLGVFAGSFSSRIAADVVQLAPATAAAWLDELVDMNMVRRERGTDRPFKLLFVLREFALEQLAQTGELTEARTRHFDWFEQLLQETADSAAAGDFAPARTKLPAAYNDLRTALDWSITDAEWAERALNVVVMLTQTDFWIENSRLAEGAARLEQVLANEAGSDLMRAAALVSAGRVAYYRFLLPEALRYGEQALALLDTLEGETAEDWQLIARRVVANAAGSMGDRDRLFAYQRQNIEIYRRRGDPIGEANSLQAMGQTAIEGNDYRSAIDYLSTSVELLRDQGDRGDLLMAVNALGIVLLIVGDYAEAEPHLQESLSIALELGFDIWKVMVYANLGHLALATGRLDEARTWFEQGEVYGRAADTPNYQFQVLIGQATLSLLEGDPLAARPFLGECRRYYDSQGQPPYRFVRMADVLALQWAMLDRPDLAVRLTARGAAEREATTGAPRFANVQPIYEQAMTLAAQALTEQELAHWSAWGRDERTEDLWSAIDAAERALEIDQSTRGENTHELRDRTQ